MRKAILLPAIFLTACSTYPQSLDFMKPYKMDIQQGNVVTSKMLLQLRPGMTKAQVRFVMGTPMISDSFHANRWDYLYRMEKNGKLIEQRHVILDFEDEKLKGVRGDVVPAAPGADAAAAKPVSHEPVPVKPASEAAPKEKGMLDKLKFWDSDDTSSVIPPSEQPPAKEDMQVLPPLIEAPGTAPASPVSAGPEAAPAPVARPEEKGLLDKLMFWKDSEPEVAPKAAVRPAVPQLPAIPERQAEPLPPLTEPPPAAVKSAPAQSAKPAPEAAPAPQPAAPQLPAMPEDKPKPPPPTQPPAAEAKPAPAGPQPAPAASPESAPKPAPTAEPKAAPKPQPDLPSEEDPSYFERLLEKIGF
jgi:outer membrane protein assembly factor BamE